MEIIIKNLNITQNQRTLFKDVSLEMKSGKIYALVGPNGSGKTTLLKSLAGLNEFGQRTIAFDALPLNSLSPGSRAKQISYLPQHSPTGLSCTAMERIAHGLIANYGLCPWLYKKEEATIRKIARHLCIEAILERRVGCISGGEQRLVHIAKSLVSPSTRVFFLDEPSVFLDFVQKEVLAKVLQDLITPNSIMIFSSHDKDFISSCAHEVLVVKEQAISQGYSTDNF